MAYDMCTYMNSIPCVGGYALQVPRVYPAIPEWTICVRMANAGDEPWPQYPGVTITRLYNDEDVYDVTYVNEDWTRLLDVHETPTRHKIGEVLGSNTTGVTNMTYLFDSQDELTSVVGLTTPNVTTFQGTFISCTSLSSVELFDTSNATSVMEMFSSCFSIRELPLFDTSKVTTMFEFCSNCRSLSVVPLFATWRVVDMGYAFYNCQKVTYGAYALYRQASSQTTPPSSHNATFRYCGIGTSSGSSQLDMIPAGWK